MYRSFLPRRSDSFVRRFTPHSRGLRTRSGALSPHNALGAYPFSSSASGRANQNEQLPPKWKEAVQKVRKSELNGSIYPKLRFIT